MIDAMVRKLDEYIATMDRAIRDGKYTPLHLMDLREILLAGKEEQPKDNGWITTATKKDIEELERRVASLETHILLMTNSLVRLEGEPKDKSHVVGVEELSKEDNEWMNAPMGKPSPAVECEHEWTKQSPEYDNPIVYCRKCMAQINKPDTIQISRRVAEECLRQTGLELPNELHDELKRGLER